MHGVDEPSHDSDLRTVKNRDKISIFAEKNGGEASKPINRCIKSIKKVLKKIPYLKYF